jgi:uroporphyrinogen-III decarboxylase
MQRIHSLYTRQLELWAATKVDGLVIADDWGGQSALLIPPVLWRKMFKPLYKDYVDIGHARGKYVFMHSDGYILEILPDLIELGIDAINAQIFCMGVEDLGRRYAGQITFWGEMDRQYILNRGTADDVTNAVRQVKESLYRSGGVIAQCEFGPGVRPENVYQLLKAWDEL